MIRSFLANERPIGDGKTANKIWPVLVVLACHYCCLGRCFAGSDFPPIATCLDALHGKKKSTTLYAIKALGDWGTPAKDAVPKLLKLLKHKDLEIRLQASIAIARIGPSAITSLLESLNDDNAEMRAWSAATLGRMGRDANQAVPELEKKLSDKDQLVRIAALQALLEAESSAEKLASLLRKAADANDRYLSLIGRLGLRRLEANKDKRVAFGLTGPLLEIEPPLSPVQEAVIEKFIDNSIAMETAALGTGNSSMMATHHELSLLLNAAGPAAIPCFVRGMNRAALIGASCSVGSLGLALTNIIRRCNDPRGLDYVLANLGTGLPPTSPYLRRGYQPLRRLCLQRKEELVVLTIIAAREREKLTKLVLDMDEKDDAGVRASLSNRNPDLRFAALHVVAHRRLRCHDELIRLLRDPQPRIVQAARLCLTRLARGTDFGPVPGGGDTHNLRAQNVWRAWWQFQDDNPKHVPVPERLLRGRSKPGAKPASEAERLTADYLKAKPEERKKLLEKLEQSKGIDYSDALAAVVSQVKGEERDRAREALVRRFTRMTARTLRDKLAETDVEVRRAAALACKLKGDRAFTPNLIDVLGDDDAEVAAAAHEALRSLTGEDFGPKADADATQRRESQKKWRAWWDKHGED